MSDLLAILAHYGCHEPNPDKVTGKIRCPSKNHDDSRASCSYDLDKGVVNCFACSFSGDAVNIVMMMEGVDVREAIKRVEQISGGSRQPAGGGRSRPGRRGYQPKFRRRHFD